MARTSEKVEREIKLDASKLDRPLSADVFADREVIADDRVTLRAEYWDTPDLRLLSWGQELRYRAASDGSEAAWTVKFAEPGSGPTMNRTELEFSGDHRSPPAAVRDAVLAFTGHDPLVPLATLTTDRHRFRLRAGGGAVVEVTDDRVTSRIGHQAGPGLHEVEVELLAGSEKALEDVASELRAAGARKGTSQPKIARVVADRLTDKPEGLPHHDLGRRSTIGELVAGAISDGTLRLLRHDPGVRTGDDPEVVHQARVATRRLRSDLKSLEPLLIEARVEPLRVELRWLGQLLGAVRDADVLAARLEAAARESKDIDGAAIRALVSRLHAERDQRMLELRDALSSDRYINLIEDLVRAARTPPLRRGVDAGGSAARPSRQIAATAWKRTAKRVRHLRRHPPDVELHEVRRRAKRARYAAELVAPVIGGAKPGRLAKRLGALQDLLGELQDTVVAEQWLRRQATSGLPSNEAFAAGMLVAQQAETRRDARARWRKAWDQACRRKLRRWMS